MSPDRTVEARTYRAPSWCWWTEDRDCSTCYPKRCQCGPFCIHCGDMLGHWTTRRTPERCSGCMATRPTQFGHLFPSGDDPVDDRRVETLGAAVEWWRSWYGLFPSGDVPRLAGVVVQLARQLDRNQIIEGQKLSDVFDDMLRIYGHGGDTLDARLACALFSDAFERDLDLLVVAYCASRAK